MTGSMFLKMFLFYIYMRFPFYTEIKSQILLRHIVQNDINVQAKKNLQFKDFITFILSVKKRTNY